MWLSHHTDDELHRCVVIAGRHVCRRCAVLYPLAILVAVAQVAGLIGDGPGIALMWVAPIGVVAEWVAEHLGGVGYSARRQVALTAVASLGLGVALGRHALHPFEPAAVVPMGVFVAVCVGSWWIGARRRPASPRWEDDFERAEAERRERLTEMLQSGLATKSMSSSTAPTSDGLRSL